MGQVALNQYGSLSPTGQAYWDADGQLTQQIDNYGVSGALGPSTWRQARSLCVQYGA